MNVVILCARMSSSRLPGKALVSVCGKPILQRIVERYQSSHRVDRVVVATSSERSDHPIQALCARMGVPCYAGSLTNVVRRMDNALKIYAPDARYVFRGLGDMPLVDIDLLDWRFDLLERRHADVVWVGFKGEPLPVYGSRESPWSRAAWDAIAERSAGSDLEHAGQWLYSNLSQFHVVYVEGPLAEYYRPYRLELDTPDDLRFFRAVYDHWHTSPGLPDEPPTLDVLRWLDANPHIAAINADVETKTLTAVNWRARGIAWACPECGAEPMITGVIRRGKLMTRCPSCGAERPFCEAPKGVD